MTPAGIERFAAHLSVGGKYASANYVFAVLRENKDRRHEFVDPYDVVGDIETACKRDTDPSEQAMPFAQSIIRRLFGACDTEQDVETALTAAGATFACSRSDAYLRVLLEDVIEKDQRVGLTLRNTKGPRSKNEHYIEFERLGGLADEPYVTPNHGSFPACPADFLLTMMERRRMTDPEAKLLNSTKDYQKYYRSLEVLLKRAGIQNVIPGRKHKLYETHSSRVGGVCTLVRAGLAHNTISVIADWTSDMIKHYAKRVMLEPSLCGPYAFYNPISLKGQYNFLADAGGEKTFGEPKKKKKKT